MVAPKSSLRLKVGRLTFTDVLGLNEGLESARASFDFFSNGLLFG